MKDSRGLFYYPYPENRRVRMYVRPVGDDICFRMWNADNADVWERHGWVPHEAVMQAAMMYRKKPGGIDPRYAYDLNVARALIADDQS